MDFDIKLLTTPEALAVIYLAAINLITFILYGVDKRRAVKGAYRIPEARLHLFALLGGFVGGIIAMQIFRHKTRKASFVIVFALATLASAAALIFGWMTFFV
jgi:uncharacterized membrane protein YsdA (DUF1294 family)